MIPGIKFEINPFLYNRDPQDTKLGQNILHYSIILIDEVGIENFNFKKLAIEIKSTEASIYRYFDNKHLLLLYLTSWYWEWVSYLIDINLKNIDNPRRKLQMAINTIVEASDENSMTTYINENKLHSIIIKEGAKVYHTSSVDEENENGVFLGYKKLVSKVSDLVKAYDKSFPYAVTLASNIFEMSNNQIYFASHLPRLTDLSSSTNMKEDLKNLLNHFVFRMLDSEAVI